MGLSGDLEREMRRINLKHVYLQYSPTYTASVYLFLIVVCWTLDRHAGHTLALFPRVLCSFMALAGVFRAFGGHISRREASEQVKQLRDMLIDVTSVCAVAAIQKTWTCVLVVSVIAELSKVLSATIIVVAAVGFIWLGPIIKPRLSVKFPFSHLKM